MPSPSPSFFDRWSSTYDGSALQLSTYRPIHDAVVERLVVIEPTMILDLGCGTGQLTGRLAGTFPDAFVVGVDYSSGMLTEASGRMERSTGTSVGFVRADAQHVPLARRSLDAAVCSESFHWYPDQAAALAGLAQSLRPGGHLLICSIATATTIGSTIITGVSAAIGRPIRALPPDELRQMLDHAGFDVIHQRRIARLGLIPWPVLTHGVLRD